MNELKRIILISVGLIGLIATINSRSRNDYSDKDKQKVLASTIFKAISFADLNSVLAHSLSPKLTKSTIKKKSSAKRTSKTNGSSQRNTKTKRAGRSKAKGKQKKNSNTRANKTERKQKLQTKRAKRRNGKIKTNKKHKLKTRPKSIKGLSKRKSRSMHRPVEAKMLKKTFSNKKLTGKGATNKVAQHLARKNGLMGYKGIKNEQLARGAIHHHVNKGSTIAFKGKYKGQPCIHYYNPKTGYNVVAERNSGRFWTVRKIDGGRQARFLSSGWLGR